MTINAITASQYNAVKNDRSFTVITFDKETGKRTLTYSNLDLLTAMYEVLLKQFRFDVLVIRNVKPGDATLPDKDAYVSKYKGIEQHLDLPRKGVRTNLDFKTEAIQIGPVQETK